MRKATRQSTTIFLSSWVYPILKKGFSNNLFPADVTAKLSSFDCETLGSKLESEWNKELEKEKHNKKPSLFLATVRFLGNRFYFYLLLQFLTEILKNVVQPAILYWFFRAVETREEDGLSVYWTAFVFCLLVLFTPLMTYQLVFTANKLGQCILTAFAFLNYKKCLRLSSADCGEYSVGQIVNHQTNDLRKLINTMNYIAQIVTGPAGLLCGLALLYSFIGISSLAGFSVILITVPLQFFMGQYNQKKRLKLAAVTDERIGKTREFIQGIRAVKMYGQTTQFAKSIQQIRKRELATIHRMFQQKCLVHATSQVSGHLMFFLTFVAAILLDHPVSLEVMFMCLAIFNGIAVTMFFCFPFGILYGSEALSAISRLQEFLLQPEIQEMDPKRASRTTHPSVRLQSVTAAWTKEGEVAIERISISVKKGELLIVVGPVSSGKSSLVSTILGECRILEGILSRRGEMCYCPSEAWLFSATIKDNIVFFQPFDPQKYKSVVETCALNEDFKQLPNFDSTLVGDEGFQLSGGQKARINLARALYRDADIYLLDDPFKAIDPTVANHIFRKGIKSYLKDKVCILVTHQLQYLEEADKVLILKKGRVVTYGGCEVIRKLSNVQTTITVSSSSSDSSLEMTAEKTALHRRRSECEIRRQSRRLSSKTHGYLQIPITNENGNVVATASAYQKYLVVMGGSVAIFLMILLFSSNQSLYIWLNFWFLHWAVELKEERNWTLRNSTEEAAYSFERFQLDALFYSGLAFANALLCFACFYATYSRCAHVSLRLHDASFKKIASASMEFFDSNHDCGRILNTLTNDMNIVDEDLPTKLTLFIHTVFRNLGIVAVGMIFKPWITFPVLLMIFACVMLTKLYFRTARVVKKIERQTNGPLLSLISATLQGLNVLRAFKVEHLFERKFFAQQNCFVASSFTFFGLVRWFSLHLHFFSVLYIFIVVWIIVLTSKGDLSILPAYAVASSLELSQQLQKTLRTFTDLDGHMISVERILKFQNVHPEQKQSLPTKKLIAAEWPKFGNISFRDVSIKYPGASLYALKDVTFRISAGEKVGIVGRTGAGKSSILMSLLRLASIEGTIVIDDVDIHSVNVDFLRQNISIIPQDPVLFSGTIRDNLDPCGEHAEYKLWKVLEDVQLKRAIERFEKGLDTEVQEGGLNFSAGLRQLLCLGKAILKNNRILVLDEATANVDLKTDVVIQETIKRLFGKCTVISIAHRLQTVMDCDKVMVLDEGHLVEYGAVSNLLKNCNSHFSKLAREMQTSHANT